MNQDPIKVLEDVASMARAYERVRNVLDRVRRQGESPDETLKRVLEERAEVVQMLNAAGISRSSSGWDSHDYNYTRRYVEAVRELVAWGGQQ